MNQSQISVSNKTESAKLLHRLFAVTLLDVCVSVREILKERYANIASIKTVGIDKDLISYTATSNMNSVIKMEIQLTKDSALYFKYCET